MLTTLQTCGHCARRSNFHFKWLHHVGIEHGQGTAAIDGLRRQIVDEKSETSAQNLVHQVEKWRPTQRLGSRGQNSDVRIMAGKEKISFVGVALCGSCHGPVMMTGMMRRDIFGWHAITLGKSIVLDGPDIDDETITCYPPAPESLAHPEWPDQIKREFADAQDFLTEGRSPSIIISTCRTVLDVTVKQLGAKGKNIADRIDWLEQQGIITKPLADWSHDIRKFGADATHDAEGTEEDAATFVAFLRQLLEMTYTWPQRIARRRENPTGDVGAEPEATADEG